MRRAFALLVTLAAAAPAVAHGGHAATRPLLRLVDDGTPMVRATGFKVREHVRLTFFTTSTRVVRQATAGTGGGFTMRMSGLDLNNCAGFGITAIGDKGSRATYKRPPGVCPVEVAP